MTRFERWQRNRMSRQLVLTNEALAQPEQAQKQNEQLREFMNEQLDLMLRVPPPRPIKLSMR